MAEKWYIYLIECADGSLYCGITTDITRRLRQHEGKISGGAKYTRSRRPLRLLCSICAPDRSQAQRLEEHIKTLPKDKKLPGLLKLGEKINAGLGRDFAL